jgi:uncharacterized membrane protein
MSRSEQKGTALLIMTSMMAALTFIATAFFKIPLAIGYVHLGDAFVFLAALILPKRYACFSAGVGAALADLLAGFAVWAPFSLIIKALMVIVVQAGMGGSPALGSKSVTVSANKKGDSRAEYPQPEISPALIISIVIAVLVNMAGYYISDIIIIGNYEAPLILVPMDILQSAAGAVVALPLSKLAMKFFA